jgi:hypothetical protein
MSYAPDYTPATDFSADESSSVAGRSTVRTANLDNEHDSISASINALNDNLQIIQRSDGELMDQVVTPHALNSDTVALFAAVTARGAWLTATLYVAGDLVIIGGATFLCVTGHTSGAFLVDYDAGLWMPVGRGVWKKVLTDGATVNWSATLSPNAEVTLGGNRTIANPTNLVTGVVYTLKVIQDGAGNHTVSWGAAFKWGVSGAPTLSTGAGKADLFSFLYDGTDLLNLSRTLGF